MSKSAWLFILLLSLQACSAEEYVLKTAAGDLCIPDHYVVEVDTSGIPSDQYDSEGGGYEISLIIKSEELTSAIEDFEKIAVRPGITGYQPMYIMLSEPLGQQMVADIPAYSKRLDASPKLVRLEQDDIAWQVAEEINGEYVSWGHCSSTFETENSYDCIRDFETGELRMSYLIDQVNVKVYPAIDALLAEKVETWKCQSRNK